MKTIVVDVDCDSARTALIDDGKLIEVIYNNEESIQGNIYLATVERVQKKFAFLKLCDNTQAFLQRNDTHFNCGLPKLKGGIPVLVQVKKNAYGDKSAYVTEEINFVGKNIILLKSPFKSGVFVSDKIEDHKKEELREFAASICPVGYSLIVRTIAYKASQEEMENELQQLKQKALSILNFAQKAIDDYYLLNSRTPFKPYLLHSDNKDICYKSTLISLFGTEVDSIVINNEDDIAEISDLANKYGIVPKYIYGDIFNEYGITCQLSTMQKSKVWLKSGGYILIEKTHALTIIDVNTGNNISKYKDVVEKTNMEATVEIAYQLRLRNISGIIIADFINTNNKDELLKNLKKEVKEDRITTVVVGITNLGLVEITRARN